MSISRTRSSSSFSTPSATSSSSRAMSTALIPRRAISLLFVEERSAILQPVLTHVARIVKDEREYEHAVRASQVLLDDEEPSARTFFCAKRVVKDYIARHPNDPRGHRELGKIYLFSCGGDETIAAAEKALRRSAKLSRQQDPETWFLIGSCHRTRLIGLPPLHPRYASTFASADRALRRALKHSHNASTYRFALADFYLATSHPHLALTTLEQGLSGREGDPADAPVWEELGKYGMRVVPELLGKGKTDEAREVAEGAVGYLRRALECLRPGETGADEVEEWRVELREAVTVLNDLREGEGTLFDFDSQPDFNPRRPPFAFLTDRETVQTMSPVGVGLGSGLATPTGTSSPASRTMVGSRPQSMREGLSSAKEAIDKVGAVLETERKGSPAAIPKGADAATYGKVDERDDDDDGDDEVLVQPRTLRRLSRSRSKRQHHISNCTLPTGDLPSCSSFSTTNFFTSSSATKRSIHSTLGSPRHRRSATWADMVSRRSSLPQLRSVSLSGAGDDEDHHVKDEATHQPAPDEDPMYELSLSVAAPDTQPTDLSVKVLSLSTRSSASYHLHRQTQPLHSTKTGTRSIASTPEMRRRTQSVVDRRPNTSAVVAPMTSKIPRNATHAAIASKPRLVRSVSYSDAEKAGMRDTTAAAVTAGPGVFRHLGSKARKVRGTRVRCVRVWSRLPV